MPKVFVVNKGGHDFSAAKKWGDVVFLTEGTFSACAVSSMYRNFSMAFRESSPDDYILLAGPSVMCSVACACFAYLHGCLNLLIYKGNRYKDRRVVMSNLLGKGVGTTPEQIEEMIKEG